MLAVFCPSSFGVLFCSLLFGCLYPPQTSGPRIVSGACFLTGGVFERDIAHSLSVAGLPNRPHLLNTYQINMGFPHFQ